MISQKYANTKTNNHVNRLKIYRTYKKYRDILYTSHKTIKTKKTKIILKGTKKNNQIITCKY